MQTLRQRMQSKPLLHVMAAHSPLSGRLAEEAGFDALWASGFELSALYGMPDLSLLSMTQHLDMTRAIAGRVAIPVIADDKWRGTIRNDTGRFSNLAHEKGNRINNLNTPSGAHQNY